MGKSGKSIHRTEKALGEGIVNLHIFAMRFFHCINGRFGMKNIDERIILRYYMGKIWKKRSPNMDFLDVIL